MRKQSITNASRHSRRWRYIFGAVISVTVLVLAFASAASAYPPCPPDRSVEPGRAVASALAFIPSEIEAGVNQSWTFLDIESISAEAATATPISHPGPLPVTSGGGKGDFSFRLEPGDGPALITVTAKTLWGDPCEVTGNKVVTPHAANIVEALRGPVRFDDEEPIWVDRQVRNADELNWDFLFTDDPPGTLAVTVWSRRSGRARVASSTSSPFEWGRTRVKNRRFLLLASVDREERLGRITFRSLRTRNAVETFRYRATLNGKRLKQGRFRVHTVYHRGRKYVDLPGEPAHRIWEGTDAFFNYCLKKNKEIFSKGGRLYCWKDAGTDYYIPGRKSYTDTRVRVLR